MSVRVHADGLARCGWLNDDELYVRYHDKEWGTPLAGDQAMFERLSLEGFREAFHGFDLARVSAMTEADVERLLAFEGIIRHRGKIEATIRNARLALELDGGLERCILDFKPQDDRRGLTQSPESAALSKALRKLGFAFVGPTTMHALMQATGMIADHSPGCYLETKN